MFWKVLVSPWTKIEKPWSCLCLGPQRLVDIPASYLEMTQHLVACDHVYGTVYSTTLLLLLLLLLLFFTLGINNPKGF